MRGDPSNWKIDEPGYPGSHSRAIRLRGPASSWCCTNCSNPAREWSQIKGTNGYVPDDYLPRCKSCHTYYDGNNMNATGSIRSDSEKLRISLMKRGTNNHNAKLIDGDIIEMRQMNAEGYWSIKEIAEIFGMGVRQTRDIINYQAWKHIP